MSNNINNASQWRDVEVEGEFTKTKYFGRFRLKPYLTHGDRADVARLAELYNRGISTDAAQRAFNMTLAFLKFHIVETDAPWWTEKGGLDLYDEAPIYALAERVRDVQKPLEEQTNPESSSKG